MTTETAASLIREAYMVAPAGAEWGIDHFGNDVLTIGDHRFVLGTWYAADGERFDWAEYTAERENGEIVGWDIVTADACPAEDVEQVREALRAFVA